MAALRAIAPADADAAGCAASCAGVDHGHVQVGRDQLREEPHLPDGRDRLDFVPCPDILGAPRDEASSQKPYRSNNGLLDLELGVVLRCTEQQL